MEYNNKLFLARMVRVGLCSFDYQLLNMELILAYVEEIIDHKLVKCDRRFSEKLGSVDFVERGTGSVVFRTCD